jgi:lipoprotein NlpI
MFRIWRRFASSRKPAPHDGALASLADRDFASAETELTALLDETAGPAERAFLFNKRGVARVATKQTAAARDDFISAIACVAGYAPALTNLGNLLLEDGQVDAAIERYETAILADAKYALAHLNLGVAYKRAGRYGDAVRALRRGLALEKPTSAFGRRSR